MRLKSFLTSWVFPAVILLTLGVTPLLEAQNQLGYEYPKVFFFIGLILGLLLLFEIFPNQFRQKLFAKSFLSVIGLLFLISISFSSFFQPQPLLGLFGQYPYYQGIVLYLFLFLFALFVGILPISLKKYSYVLVVSACWIALVSLYQWVGIHVFHLPIGTYSGRVVSTFGQPNLYSGYLAMLLPFFMVLMEKVKSIQRILLGIGAGIVLLGIAVSVSRLAWILVGIMGIVSVLFYLRKSIYFTKVALGLGIFCVVFGSVAIPRIIQTEFVDPYNYTWLKLNNPEKRVYIWQVALSQGLKRPILGYGVDTFRDVYSSYFTDAPKEASYYSRRVLVVDRAHNYVLDLFVYAGVVGVVLWVMLVSNMLVKLRKQRWLLLGLVLYLLFALIHPQSIMQLIFFWFLAGLAVKPASYFKD